MNPAPGASVTPLVIGPAMLSLTVMFVRATLPQLVTVPLMSCGWPTTTVWQVFVTAKQTLSVTRHVFVAVPVATVPQLLVPVAVTMFVFALHAAVTVLL